MSRATEPRVDWVDYAKGFCIIFVVMMHSTLGIEKEAATEGWLHPLIVFALPFRMPDFFMISGLFLATAMRRDWRTYIDRKVVHFAYFYLLWTAIEIGVKAPGIASGEGMGKVVQIAVMSLIDPYGVLWFIYLLPIFFIFIRLTNRVPVAIMWGFGALLEMSHLNTGWMVPDEFAARFVYCYTGYVAARFIFSLAATAQRNVSIAVLGLCLWALTNGAAVYLGIEQQTGVSLVLGLLGACAVVTASALMAKCNLFQPIRYCGANSIVIYLAFFLPMAAARNVILFTGIIGDIGLASVITTVLAVVGALALFWAVRSTWASFLFQRPNALRWRTDSLQAKSAKSAAA